MKAQHLACRFCSVAPTWLGRGTERMGKRLRSLPSLLWETDCEDGMQLHKEWSASQWSGSALAIQTQKVKQLEQDIGALHAIIKDLQNKLRGDALPVIETCVVKKPSLSQMKCKDAWYFLSILPETIRDLPRMRKEIIPDLERSNFASGCVAFDLCDAKLASALLGHVELSIRSLTSKCPTVFKIGITRNPVARWAQGYSQDATTRWATLHVLLALPDALSAGLVEAAMISRFGSCSGNRNIQRGGEGVDMSGAGPYFVYCVVRPLCLPNTGNKC